MYLIDTSTWVALLRGHDIAETRLLRKWIWQDDTCAAPVIIQELLMGARGEKQLERLEQRFRELPMLQSSTDTHVLAGTLYARCRWRGITIRSPNDCLIAALAVEHGVPLLTLDGDFRHIARVESALMLIKAD